MQLIQSGCRHDADKDIYGRGCKRRSFPNLTHGSSKFQHGGVGGAQVDRWYRHRRIEGPRGDIIITQNHASVLPKLRSRAHCHPVDGQGPEPFRYCSSAVDLHSSVAALRSAFRQAKSKSCPGQNHNSTMPSSFVLDFWHEP